MRYVISVVTALLLNLASFAANATVADLAVTDIQLVGSQRVSRTNYEYTFTATLNNAGGPLENVVATATSTTSAVQIVEGAVVFGTVATGDTISGDTFKVRHNRRYRFNPRVLIWSFTADEPAGNTAPTADAGPDRTVSAGDSVNLDGSGSFDPDEDPLTYAWFLSVPAGSSASLSDNQAQSPSYTADMPGTYVATLRVNDGIEDSAPDSATATAIFAGENAPTITSSASTSGSVNTPYAYNVNATDPDAGDTLTYSLQLAPAGMGIDPQSGLITWTPDSTGPADVDVIVTDSTGRTDRQIYLILVNNGDDDQPPALAPITDQLTVINQTMMVTAAGNDPEGETLRYSVIGAPSGLGINISTGELFWTPDSSQAGNFNATVTVMDPGGQTAQESFNITVLSETPNNPPSINTVADQNVDALATIQITLSATDPDANDILVFNLSGAPTGMQFDPLSGTLNWIPGSSDAGTVNLTAGVTDSAGATDNTSFAITVAEQPQPPVAVDDAYTVDRDAQLQIPAEGVLANDTDPNNDVLSAANTSVTMLGTLDSFPGDGSFTYTPPANPHITIGLRKRCQMADRHGSHIPLVGDWDHDGSTDIIGLDGGGFTSRLYVYDGADCSAKQPVILLPSSTHGVMRGDTPMAMANLDADPDLELILIRQGPPQLGTNKARLVAINIDDGSLVWSLPDGASEAVSLPLPTTGLNYYEGIGPTVIDLDGDGAVEILMPLAYRPSGVSGVLGAIICYNADGTIRWEFSGAEQGGDDDSKPLAVADLDLDGTLEIIYHTNVVDHSGNLEFNLATDPGPNFLPQHLTVAIANFDNDPFPEILGMDGVNMYLFEHTPGPATWTVPTPALASTSEITVGDFDGDGLPEFAFHGGFGTGNDQSYLNAFDTDGSLMWSHKNTLYDGAASTIDIGITAVAFDYDQDGKDELTSYLRTSGVQNVGEGIFIFEGDTGTEIASYIGDGTPHFILGGRQIYPLIADLDADGASEIVYPISTGLGVGPLFVIEGSAGNPFPPARAIRNQLNNQLTHVALDGSIPAYPAPPWLIPGLNKYHGVGVVPFEDPGLTDDFTYLANDGTADSNEATVSIAVTNVNAPTIISNPALGASPDFEYIYGVLATDADFGEVFTWALVDGPSGMTLSQLGVVNWTPQASDLGSQRVHIVVTDGQGNSDEQSFTIEVVPPVVVPDLLNLSEADAIAAIENGGLAVGSVTQGFSFTVPAGEIISQSVAGAETSPAGAFINLVVSLGPRPIFVPSLDQLAPPAAQTLLESEGLFLGTVTNANSDTIPAGLTISQSVAPNSQVAFESNVDITVSSGPALVVALASPIMQSGTSQPVSITVFDNNGIPLAPQPNVAVTLDFEPAEVLGATPSVNATQIDTSADTRGGFSLQVDAGAFGNKSLDFIVRLGLSTDAHFGPIADFANTIEDAGGVYSGLIAALQANDLVAIQALGEQLVSLRASIDLDELARRNPFALEEGFLPDHSTLVNLGFGASFGEFNLVPFQLASLEQAIAESDSFLENLTPFVGRDDDVRARALNDALQSQLDSFFSSKRNVGAYVFFNGEYASIFAQKLPKLLATDLDASIRLLTDAGLLAAVNAENGEQIAQLSPGEFYANTRPAFFSLIGVMSASSIRTTLITKLYVPHIKNLVAAGLLVATADAIVGNPQAINLTGIITGASLSFHKFLAGNTIVEAEFLSDKPTSYEVGVVGPNSYLDAINDLLAVANASNAGEFLGNLANLKATADAAESSFELARVAQVVRGCILDQNPNCKEILLRDGFKVVHSNGPFPAPVLVIITDLDNYKTYSGVFPFFPN